MDFASVKEGLDQAAFVLIDVRNASEIKASGKIPGSVNIPRKLTLKQGPALLAFNCHSRLR